MNIISKNLFKKNIYIFLIFLAIFLPLKLNQPIVWNDSPRTTANIYGLDKNLNIEVSSSHCDQILDPRWTLESKSEIYKIFDLSFHCTSDGGFRPLTNILVSFITAALSDEFKRDENTFQKSWTFFIAIFFSFIAVIIFKIINYFLLNKKLSLIATFFYIFSPPVASGSWVIFNSFQLLVPLFISSIFLIYFNYIKSNKIYYLIILCILLFSGPWFREFIGISVFVIIFYELIILKKFNYRILIFIIFAIHSLFPSLFVNFFMSTNVVGIENKSIFSVGHLGTEISKNNFNLKNFILNLRGNSVIYLILTVPPIFFLIYWIEIFKNKFLIFGTLIFLFLFYLSTKYLSDSSLMAPIMENKIIVILFSSSLALLISTSFIINSEQRKIFFFLIVWFLGSMSPFLFVFTSQIHLAYAALPFIIILFYIFSKVLENSSYYKSLFFYTLLIVALADQTLSTINSYRIVHTIYNTIEKVSFKLTESIPKNSVVISNALHIEDMRFYSKNYFIPYWMVDTGIPYERILASPKKITEFILFDKRKKYILDINQDYKIYKANYHANKIINRRLLNVADKKNIGSIKEKYYFIDPLKNLISNKYHAFTGPADLENDFYYGFSKDKKFNQIELSVNYDLYEIKDKYISENLEILPNNTFYTPQCFKEKNQFKICAYKNYFFILEKEEQLPSRKNFISFVNNDEIKLYYSYKKLITDLDNY